MTNIFKELKNSKGIFDDLDKNTLRSVIKSFNNTSMSVDDLAQKFGGLNTETITYLKSAKRGEASLEGLSASMTSASISTKLLSVALNALSGLAISLIIKGFTWALDELIVTLDEQKQKLDEAVTAYEESKSELEQINDELKTTGERIDELNDKENLTFTEQDELEKLIKTNDELERKIYLLEQANKEAEKEVATEAQNTYDKYTNDRTIGAVEQIDFYADSSLLEGVSWNNFKGDLSWLVAQYKNQQEILTNAQANGWTQIEEQTKSNLELLEGYMSDASLNYQDLYDKISGISDYAMTDELKVAKQDLDDILDIVAEILGYGGQRPETSFDNIWNSEDFSQYKTELETLAKEGKLDASVLESNENYKKLLEDTGTTAEDTAQHINALVDEIGKTGQEANKIDVFSSFEGSEIGERLQYLTQQFKDGELTYKEYFDALQNEIDNVDFSNYTDSLDEASKAAQQFFTDSMQQTATGLSDLISKFDEGSISITEYLEGYVSIAETLSSLTDNLQENSASWDKNGEAIDNATSKALDETQSKLDSAISTIASYQDSIYSLEQIMTQSVEVGSDEFNAHAQVIAQDLYNIVQAGGLMADEVANTLGTTTSEIAKSLTENVSNQSLAAQAISANTNTAITNMATAVGELFDSLGEAISNFKVDVTFGVKSITTKTADLGLLGKVQLPAIKFGIEADGESLSAIGDAVSSFGKSVASNFAPQTIDINDYLFRNTEAGKNSNYTPSGDILNNYNNTLDKIKKTGEGTSQVIDWIETKVKRLQRTITNLGKTVSATWKSWTDRNSALKSQISAVTSEINLQQQAADKYLSLANGVGLSGTYKELVRNGSLNISTITDENTIDAIKKYKEYYENYLSALDAKQDAEDELANLVREDFDMIAKQFDSEISLVEANISTLEAYIDQTEMKGNLVSKNYYSAMYAEEQKNLAYLQQKYDQLSNKLSNGTIVQGSEEFNEMATQIKEVSKAIIESNTALEEYQKTMRELDWEVFDLIEEKIGNVTEESEFLIDLLSNSKLFNDNGSITSQGQATIGLHVANYSVYTSQIKDYSSELENLDSQFAHDSLDQNYLKRREELVQLQREAILNCENEKSAIKDLYSDGMDNLLSYIDKLISKRKELLNSQKD